uniref:Uncharacterized protein n=1 Tax=Tanacetum cinerariifolium TaxID=118510 RepID=A0A699JKW1_TANCI|nr:hypothetical protein [Tanacetum cinerariifolium]
MKIKTGNDGRVVVERRDVRVGGMKIKTGNGGRVVVDGRDVRVGGIYNMLAVSTYYPPRRSLRSEDKPDYSYLKRLFICKSARSHTLAISLIMSLIGPYCSVHKSIPALEDEL